MDIYDWAAILGALSWAVPIFQLIKEHFKRPKIMIIPNDIELGFTSLGPILNPNLAFLVKNGDLVITNFKINVKHENGEKNTFKWHQTYQQEYEIQFGKIPKPVSKISKIPVLKLQEENVTECAIRCRETSFIEGSTPKEESVKELLRLSKNNEKPQIDIYRGSKELSILNEFYQDSFSWKKGRYKIMFEIETSKKFNLVENEYEFILNTVDIDLLEKNKKLIKEQYLDNHLDDNIEINYYWRKAKIHKINHIT